MPSVEPTLMTDEPTIQGTPASDKTRKQRVPSARNSPVLDQDALRPTTDPRSGVSRRKLPQGEAEDRARLACVERELVDTKAKVEALELERRTLRKKLNGRGDRGPKG